MTDLSPHSVPALADLFAHERENLRAQIANEDLSTAQAVAETRRALDRTGAAFVRATGDANLQRAGLWLLEVIKSGVGSLDRGQKPEIVWREIPKKPGKGLAGQTLYFSAAFGFMIAGLVQGSRLTILAATALAALRLFDLVDWAKITARLKIFGRSKRVAIEGPDGRAHLVDVRIGVNGPAFMQTVNEGLSTADQILKRLAEPKAEYHWHDDPRLLGFVQSLLEAAADQDKDFAFKLIDSELRSVLTSEGIELVEYSPRTEKYFDVLPALDGENHGIKQAAPALKHGGEIIKRGTVWKQ